MLELPLRGLHSDTPTDVLILCVPVPLVWGLHTSLARRLSLLFIFSLGSFVVFASIYRLITIFEFQYFDTSCLIPYIRLLRFAASYLMVRPQGRLPDP